MNSSFLARPLVVILAAWLFVHNPASVQGQIEWDLVNANLTAAAYGNGTYVVLEQNSWAWTSKDLVDWEKHPLAPSVSLNAVAFGNGAFVAVGADCWILRSTNGVDWSSYQYPFLAFWGYPSLNNVAFLNGQFVIVGGYSSPDGNRGLLLTSPDGVTWTKQFEGYLGLNGIAFGDGGYLAVGRVTRTWRPYATVGVVAQSEDSVTWSSTELPQPAMMDVAFGNGVFVATTNARELWTLVNDKWERALSGTGQLRNIVFGNGRFAAADHRSVMYWSADGLNWTNQVLDLPLDPQAAWSFWGSVPLVEFANGRFLVLADGGTVLSSVDGADWTVHRSNYVGGFADITYGKGIFVGLNRSSALTSSNGLAWTRHVIATNLWPKQMVFGADRFIVIGTATSSELSVPLLFTSADGTNWHQPELPAVGEFETLSFAKDRFFVKPLNGPILTSTDGEHWTIPESAPEPWHVAYGNGRFVGTGGGRGWVSTNGLEWTSMPSPDARMPDITFGRGVFVAVEAFTGSISASTNGLDWQVQHPAGYYERYESVDYLNGVFVAVGRYGRIATSLDGLAWSRRSATFNESHWSGDTLAGTAYGNGLYISADRRGHLQISHPEVLIQIQRLAPNSSVEFFVAPGAADRVDLQTSNDLTHWTTVLTVPRETAISSPLRHDGGFHSSHAFYRAVSDSR